MKKALGLLQATTAQLLRFQHVTSTPRVLVVLTEVDSSVFRGHCTCPLLESKSQKKLIVRGSRPNVTLKC